MARKAGADRHRDQAARRPRQGHRPRALHLRHQSSRDDLRQDGPLALRARAGRVGGPVRGGKGAGRQGGARLRAAGRAGHVSGRSGRGGRGRHRGALPRRGAHDPRALRGAAAFRERRAGDGGGCAGRVPERQHAPGLGRRNRRPRRRLRQGGARRRGDLLDARDRPRLPRDARHRVRMGRRQADRVDLDSGRDPERAGLRAGAWHPAGQRPHHHAVHGRRLRQQVRARRAGHHLRQAGAHRQAAGEADARSQGRASRHRQPSVGDGAHPRRRHRRRHADRVRRPELGHRRRRRAERVPAAVHLQLPEPQADPQGRLHQRRPAARDARAGTSAGLFPDGDPDGRARRSREDGSGRVPREEPAAGRAQRDVGRVLRARREGVRLGQAACDRRSGARPDQDRHGRVGAPLGRRGAGITSPHGHHIGRRRGDQVRHAGHRHRHADDCRDRRGRNARPAGK